MFFGILRSILLVYFLYYYHYTYYPEGNPQTDILNYVAMLYVKIAFEVILFIIILC